MPIRFTKTSRMEPFCRRARFSAGMGERARALHKNVPALRAAKNFKGSIKAARDRAYAAVEKIAFEKNFYRKDIAWRALKR